MFSMQAFHRQYQTEIRESVIGERPFRFLVPLSLEPFIDPTDLFHQFPLWTKIWEASLLLAHRVAAMPPEADRTWLELGAGLGVVGVVAAAFEHRITITEYDTQALDFIRANLTINGARPEIARRLDWMAPDLTERFDRILGSELIYNERHFPALKHLFQSLLKPGGEILLAGEVRQTSRGFLDLMAPDYQIEIAPHTLRSDTDRIRILLMRLRPKNTPNA
jgi:hypothetical protein